MANEMTDQQVLSEAFTVIDQAFVGLMTTVDKQGLPYARFMGACTMGDGVARLYTLTSVGTRKLDQLADNSAVTWVFHSPNYGKIITLYGQAREMASPVVAQPVWDRLADCAKAYSMNALSNRENVDFAIIETVVERVEFIAPREKIVVPIEVQVPVPE